MRVPKYRKHSRGVAFIEHAGRRIYLPGKYGSRESREAYTEFLRSLDAPVLPAIAPGQRPLVADLVDLAMETAPRRYTGRNGATECGHIAAVCGWLMAVCGSLPLEEFGPRKLVEIRLRLVSGDWATPPRPWSRQQINRQIGRLRRMVRWGIAAELCPPAVLAALESVEPLRPGETAAPELSPVSGVPLEHVLAVVPFVSPVVGAMIQVQAATGMRSQSVCDLRPADIHDGLPGTLVYRPPRHKSDWRGSTLSITLGPRAIAVLLPWLDRGENDLCFSPRESERLRLERVRTRKKGRRKDRRPVGDAYTTTSYYRACVYGQRRLNKARERAGFLPLPHWHPHQIRHAVATAIRDRYGLEAAQIALGHARADITQLYAERDLRLAARVAIDTG